jgi:hypothetical protein
MERAATCHGFFAINSYPDNVQIRFATQQQPQARPGQLVIINDEEAGKRGMWWCYRVPVHGSPDRSELFSSGLSLQCLACGDLATEQFPPAR